MDWEVLLAISLGLANGILIGVWFADVRRAKADKVRRDVYVVTWDDILAVRDVFVVSDRGVADQLSRWVSLGKNSVRGTPVVSVTMVVCGIDDIPAELRLDEVMDERGC